MGGTQDVAQEATMHHLLSDNTLMPSCDSVHDACPLAPGRESSWLREKAAIAMALWLGCITGCQELPPHIPSAEGAYSYESIQARRASVGQASGICVLGVRTAGHSLFVDLLVECPEANADSCRGLAFAIGLRLSAKETQPDWIRIRSHDIPTGHIPVRRLKGMPTIGLFGHPAPPVPPPVVALPEECVAWIQTVGLSVKGASITSGAAVIVQLTTEASKYLRVNYDTSDRVVVVQEVEAGGTPE